MKSQGVIDITLIMRFITREKLKKAPMPMLVHMVELQISLFIGVAYFALSK
jgi:hypothetical protein